MSDHCECNAGSGGLFGFCKRLRACWIDFQKWLTQHMYYQVTRTFDGSLKAANKMYVELEQEVA